MLVLCSSRLCVYLCMYVACIVSSSFYIKELLTVVGYSQG